MQRKIHVFFFLHDLAPFGAQRVILSLARHLDKEVFLLTVCSFWGDETLAPDFRACGAEVVFLRARRFLDFAAWARLLRELFARRPDLVKTSMPELSVPVRLLGVLVPWLRVVHSVENPISSEPVYWRLLNRATFCLCRAVIFCSRGIMEEAAPAGCLLRRVSVIQNGIEPAAPAGDSAGLRAELGAGPGEKIIFCAGRLARQKGQDTLIEALALLVGRGRALRLALAGDGEDLEALKALAGRLGVAGRVVFLGRRADIPRLLEACDVYASGSRWEGLSLALCEAMLAGRPCAATAIPGHADVLQNGVTGLAVPPEDPARLAAAIAAQLDEPAAAARMAAAARGLVRADFTAEAMTRKYAAVYAAAAGKGAA
ncbi:MAG: glycosyltransferase [Elusimicrobiales bacterium]|nr:glycosyltransferase [Elusimicrobiales bacterium]